MDAAAVWCVKEHQVVISWHSCHGGDINDKIEFFVANSSSVIRCDDLNLWNVDPPSIKISMYESSTWTPRFVPYNLTVSPPVVLPSSSKNGKRYFGTDNLRVCSPQLVVTVREVRPSQAGDKNLKTITP